MSLSLTTNRHSIPERLLRAGNQDYLCKIPITRELIDQLQELYHDVHGHPAFLREFLACNPASNEARMLFNHPEMTAWLPDGSAVLMPTYPYVDREALIASPSSYKSRAGGLEIGAWYIHPRQLEASIFADPENRQNPERIRQIYQYVPTLERPSDTTHSMEQLRIREMEEDSGVPYLASVLDLTPQHLPWLLGLRKMAHDHLKEQYGVIDSDRIDLFFHILVNFDTATLHLHVNANQGRHPFDEQKSLKLDDIIVAFENGQTIEDMLLAQREIYLTPENTKLLQLLDLAEYVRNPFVARGRG